MGFRDGNMLMQILTRVTGVSKELGDAPNALGTMSSLVGYAIRLESNTSKNTRLTYVTNGIALRMLEGGSGHGGQGTAFDDITVSADRRYPSTVSKPSFQHIIIDEVCATCQWIYMYSDSNTRFTNALLNPISFSLCSNRFWSKGGIYGMF